jgi:hypothetical protein
MTNKKMKNINKAAKNGKSKKKFPWEGVGSIVGAGAGAASGIPGGPFWGSIIGGTIGSIIGNGDYVVNGPKPTYNVIMNGQIPKFSTSRATNIVTHREYLGEIQGASGFVNRQFPLNPGIPTTFPWLSTIAQNYQEYKFHGLLFEFRSLVTDFVTGGAPGAIIMATNYNSDAPAFVSKQEMENSEFATSTKPTCNLMHGIECAISQTVFPHLFVRTGTVSSNQDLKTLDQGLFQLATQGNPAQNLGELWVTYVVEFFKPILPADVGGNVLSVRAKNTLVSNAAPLGTGVPSIIGDLPLTLTTTSFTFPAFPGNQYLFTLSWIGSSAIVFSQPTLTYVGLAEVVAPVWNGTAKFVAPNPPVATQMAIVEVLVVCTALNPSLVTVSIAGGTIPTTEANVVVTQWSSEA